MAKKFKLFNSYEKEGRGVSKTEKLSKKGFVVFFELYFQNFGKLLTAGFLNLLFCIPVLTNGLADVGLTNITRNIYCGRHSFGASDFFETIKKNWKQALPLGILKIVTGVIIFIATYYYVIGEGNLSAIGLGVCIFAIFVFLSMLNYIPLLTISFGLKIKKIISNSFKFVFLNVWRNILIILIDAFFVAVGLLVILYGDSHAVTLSIYIVLMLCFYPAFRTLSVQFLVFPSVRKYMIDPYYEEHPDADIELRRSMGLLPPEDGENVFNDELCN